MLLSFFLVFIVIPFGTSSLTSQKEPMTSECGKCEEDNNGPVCGTDNQTYATKCHLIKAQCSGYQVGLKYIGSCKECLETRFYALSHRSAPPNKFIPRCHADGSYAAVQCMKGTGCWCSDKQGKSIPHTTTRNGKPNCLRTSKFNIRRSPLQNVNRSKKGCTKSDQIHFNANLVKVFHNEYNRYQFKNTQNGDGIPIRDKIVLDWKFSSLDTNGNYILDKIEYRELRRLIKKVVKPKRCARTFGKYCDINHDESLSRHEWTKCFSMDGINHDANQAAISVVGDDEASESSSYDDYEGADNENDSEEHFVNSRHNTLRSGLFAIPTTYPPIYLIRPKTIVETDPVLRENENESDCLADRAVALDEQKAHLNSAQTWYVPECTADGRYQRVQCYRSVGYCWCVHEDTGKNIPGTSIKDGRPDCVNNSTRPMQGCPQAKKNDFLKNLKEFLRVHLTSDSNTDHIANSTNWGSEDEKIGTLSFVLLDKNKNKVWERKEWKAFRDLVTETGSLRKCGKKMPRYCDVNNDKKISLSEWLNCLQVHTKPSREIKVAINEIRTTSQTTKLKGPNPLESYLKSD